MVSAFYEGLSVGLGFQGLWAKCVIRLRSRRQAILSCRVARDGRISENVDPGTEFRAAVY